MKFRVNLLAKTIDEQFSIGSQVRVSLLTYANSVQHDIKIDESHNYYQLSERIDKLKWKNEGSYLDHGLNALKSAILADQDRLGNRKRAALLVTNGKSHKTVYNQDVAEILKTLRDQMDVNLFFNTLVPIKGDRAYADCKVCDFNRELIEMMMQMTIRTQDNAHLELAKGSVISKNKLVKLFQVEMNHMCPPIVDTRYCDDCSCTCALPEGPEGRKGIDGPSGPDGCEGCDGQPGNPGQDGRCGLPGPNGVPGMQGKPGSPGVHGMPGTEGSKGHLGNQGVEGIQGRAGRPGQSGSEGHRGPEGPCGAPGNDGDVGLKGEKGDKGATGQAGNCGEPGKAGHKGQAWKGRQDGLSGNVGAQGNHGFRGQRGSKGQAGSKGDAGSKGKPGLPGLQGKQGNPGRRGKDGECGPRGIKGNPGKTGAPGMLATLPSEP